MVKHEAKQFVVASEAAKLPSLHQEGLKLSHVQWKCFSIGTATVRA